MPDTEPKPPTDTVLAEPLGPGMTQTQALRQVGWIQPIDFVLLGLIAATWVTLLYWNIFGEPTPMETLSCCLIAFAIVQVWAILLIFRCSHFVLLLTAHVNNMPDVAARMVIGYYSGSQGPQVPQRPTFPKNKQVL